MPEDMPSNVDTQVESSEIETVETQENEELEAQDSPDVESEQEEAPKPSNKRKFKIKVDGEEIEEEIDLDNEEELRKHLQLSKAAMKRMSEAAKAQKQAEMFIQKLKTNPREVLENPNLGVDFRQIAEEYLYEQLQRESMTPEEIEYQEKMKRLEQYEKAEQENKTKAEQDRVAKMQEHYAEEYDKKITQALAESNLPKTASTVKRMAQLLSKNIDLGLDLDPSDLVEEVRKSYVSELKEVIADSNAEQLIALFGDEIANKIRKHDISKLTAPRDSRTDSNNIDKPIPAPKTDKGYMTPDEYKAWLNSRIKE